MLGAVKRNNHARGHGHRQHRLTTSASPVRGYVAENDEPHPDRLVQADGRRSARGRRRARAGRRGPGRGRGVPPSAARGGGNRSPSSPGRRAPATGAPAERTRICPWTRRAGIGGAAAAPPRKRRRRGRDAARVRRELGRRVRPTERRGEPIAEKNAGRGRPRRERPGEKAAPPERSARAGPRVRQRARRARRRGRVARGRDAPRVPPAGRKRTTSRRPVVQPLLRA